MSWELVSNDEVLRQALGELAKHEEIAVDTEFMRRNTFFPQVALLQIGNADKAWLIDPLTISDLGPLRDFFANPSQLKVLHSCSEDLEVFRHWLGVLPAPLTDTQRVAALVGEGYGVGYRTLVERALGVSLDKGETRSNWLARPLSESQCHYAAQDVIHLLPVWTWLSQKGGGEDRRAWFLEEGERAAAELSQRELDGFRRVKGSGKLNQRQLLVLRSLYEWREQRAQRLDKPRGWVLEDRACVAIAAAMPKNIEKLARLEVLPESVVRKQGSAILSHVETAQTASDEELPEPGLPPLAPAERALLKSLKSELRTLCEQLNIAPELAMANSDLERLLRMEGQGVKGEPTERWEGWRRDAVVEPLRQFLARARA
ncbi:MAG: ribonuclease D [Pseudomonadota bacterium]